MSDTTSSTLPADMLAPVNSLTKSFGDIKGKMAAVQKEEIAASDAQDKALAGEKSEIDKQRADLRTFVADNPFPKPNVKPFSEKQPENNPIERFGSWASALGILAGAITKTGLESSLNASASAMNAMRKNDLDAFDTAHQAWKENTEIAYKNAEWEAKGYLNAFELMKTDQAAGLAAAEVTAAQADNKAALAKIKQGDLSTLWSMAQTMSEFAMKAPGQMQELDQIATQNRRLMQLKQDYMKEHPGQPVPPDVELKFRTQVARESQVQKPLTDAQLGKINEQISSYDSVFDAMDFVRNHLDAFSVGIAGKVGRAVEDVGEVLNLMDDDERTRMRGQMAYIKENLPKLMVGASRQPTPTQLGELEKMMGGDAAGSTIQNVRGRLDDMQDRLFTKYDVLRREGGVSAREQGTGDRTPAPGGVGEKPQIRKGAKAKDTDGNIREFQGGDADDEKNWKIVKEAAPPNVGAF